MHAFSHILCAMHGISILHAVIGISIPHAVIGIFIPNAVISSVARNLFHPRFLASFAKPFRRSTVLPRYGVSHFSLSNTLRLTANEKDPRASLGMTLRETCFLTHSLCDAWDIHSPHCHRDIHSPRCHFERREKSFSYPFSPLLR